MRILPQCGQGEALRRPIAFADLKNLYRHGIFLWQTGQFSFTLFPSLFTIKPNFFITQIHTADGGIRTLNLSFTKAVLYH